MVEIYTHELGGESSSDLLAAYGVVPKSIDGKVEMLQPKICPMCSEPNKLDARFCANAKCGMPLTFDAFEELRNKEEKLEEEMKKQIPRAEDIAAIVKLQMMEELELNPDMSMRFKSKEQLQNAKDMLVQAAKKAGMQREQ